MSLSIAAPRSRLIGYALTILALTATLSVSLIGWAGAARAEASADVVKTRSGPVQGLKDDISIHFRGIPYAQAPVGALRWKVPKPAAAWTEIRNATAYGPACMQAPRAGLSMSEDCLSLNVSVPAGAKPGDRLPVLVRIHGGGFVSGSGSGEHSSEVWNPEGVILVTMNYRMGAFGVFADPLLVREAKHNHTPMAANLALLDIKLALKWVHANITAFGGDAGNVTLTGVSAGGEGVDLMMVTPGVDGLFARAIAASGYTSWPLPCAASQLSRHKTCIDASAVSRDIATRANHGVAPKSIAELRALPATALVSAVKGFVLPVIDGTTVPDDPLAIFAAGKQSPVPMITGGNSYEGSVYPASGVTPQEVLARLGSHQDEVRRLYADDFAASEGQGVRRVFGDMRYVLSAADIATLKGPRQPTWIYYVTYVDPAWRKNLIGSPHGGETLTMEHGDKLPGSPGRAMRRYWANFIRTGNPNGVFGEAATPSLPEWPATTTGPRRWMVFGEKIGPQDDVLKAKLDALEAARLDLTR